VTLCESRSWIGGQIRLAAMIPGRQEIGDMLPWYARQLAKHGVQVRLDTTVDAAMFETLAPDVVFVATGMCSAGAPEYARRRRSGGKYQDGHDRRSPRTEH